MDGRAKGIPDLDGVRQLSHLNGPGETESPGFSEKQIVQIRKLTQIGRALSAERNIERLLEMIVQEAREFTGADGGTLYIMSNDETELQFAIVQTETLDLRMGGMGAKITWKPVRLLKPDGSPNHENVSAHVALTGKTVNLCGTRVRLPGDKKV
jgi:hypothetical protein